jgi:UDP-N-acetylmuramoyl-L-alanyl-D-glutamate--2,6-diaminopimelate ligase
MIKSLAELTGSISNYKGVTDDSRKVGPGFIFVAVRGIGHDGHDFIEDALGKGATFVVGENKLPLPNYLQVTDSREALGILASSWFGNPSAKLKIIGVTGTKGKTTTAHIIYHILTSLGKKVGILSSISVPGLHVTSPDTLLLHKYLRKFVDDGDEYAVVEVSSHGIDQKRIAGVAFDVGVLTNIAPEHLDYHKTFKEYKRVKMAFLNSCKSKVVAPKATLIDVLPGKYNNLDAEAALEAVEAVGVARDDALSTLPTFKLPEGRLTEVENNLGVKIVIDFAHTPDSLKAVLSYLKGVTKGKLISVFGCAGERDPGKRFKMGKASVKLADVSIFTAEDPRGENIFDILSKMAEGARSVGGKEKKNFFRIAERGEAIAYALSICRKSDTVAILGKGHEKSMAYDGFEHPWGDRRAVENFLGRDKGISAIVLAAGKGTRMKSTLPKVIHKICGRPMIVYTLENLRAAGVGDIVTVISFKRNLVTKYLYGAPALAIQKNPKGGTADAAKVGFEKVSKDSEVLVVINGDDSAFYKPETIRNIVKIHKQGGRKLTFVSLIREDPTGLGRVVRGKDGKIIKIVEERDATSDEKEIKEINDGLYVFDKEWFAKNVGKVGKSASGELYLVDLIKMAIEAGVKMDAYKLVDDSQWQGVNTVGELEKARSKMEQKLKKFNE